MAGAGCALVCLAIVAWLSLKYGAPSRREFLPLVVLPFVVLVVDGLPAIVMGTPRGRRWFREDVPARWLFAVLCWLQLPVFVVIFVANVS